MSKRRRRAWSASSSGVSRSKSSVAKPARFSVSATKRFRGLKRLLPLPCAKSTIARARDGTTSLPGSIPNPNAAAERRSRVHANPAPALAAQKLLLTRMARVGRRGGLEMLWTIIGILFVLWLLGVVAHVGGGLIHLLLIVALVVF